jgi:hypothetical protein
MQMGDEEKKAKRKEFKIKKQEEQDQKYPEGGLKRTHDSTHPPSVMSTEEMQQIPQGEQNDSVPGPFQDESGINRKRSQKAAQKLRKKQKKLQNGGAIVVNEQ